MPKKTAKTTNKSDENVSHTEESLQYNGQFAHDFPLACAEQNLPAIVVKVVNSEEGAQLPQEDTDTQTGINCVEIKYGPHQDPSTKKLQSLSIKGWLVTNPIIEALTIALKTSQVDSIYLWNVGLNSQCLSALAQLAVQVQCSSLAINSTPLDDLSSLACLGSSINSVQILHLRNCSLTDPMLEPLVDVLAGDCNLKQLVLSHNKITDDGASLLAKALRFNRSLISLSLTSNRIGDLGAARMAMVLKEFPMTHEEIVQRRHLISTVYTSDWSTIASQQSSRLSSSSKLSPSKSIGKSGRNVKNAISFLAKTRKATSESAKKRKDKQSSEGQTLDSRPSSSLAKLEGPLMDDVVEKGLQVIAPGNRTLAHLALQYNRITSIGCEAVLSAVEHQINTPLSASTKPGLKKVSLHHNCFSEDHEVYCKIQHLLPPIMIPDSTQASPSPPAPSTT